MAREQKSGSVLQWFPTLTVAAIAVLVAITFAPSVWRLDPLIDEMYHLESWRNRYGTDDPLPVFHVRLAATGKLTAGQKDWLADLYRTSPLFRRLLFVQSDPPSPLHSALGEIIQAASNSSVVALRIPSLIAAVGVVWLMYLLGRRLLDPGLACCLASLACVGPLVQTYAGVGRSHMLAQFALTGLLYSLIGSQEDPRRSPARFLAWAVLAQVSHWSTWAVVGPVVGAEFIRRLTSGCSFMMLLKQSAWYLVTSVALIGVFVLQNVGTTAAGNMTGTFQGVWDYFCHASPFGFASQFGRGGFMTAAGLLFAALALAGACVGLRETTTRLRAFVIPVIAGVCGSLIGMYFMTAGIRHMLIYQAPWIVLAGIGLRYACGTATCAMAVACGTVVLSALVALANPVDPYENLLHGDIRYSQPAAVLRRELRPGERWAAWPYYQGNAFFPFGPFPVPFLPNTEGELLTIMTSADAPRFLFTTVDAEAANRASLPTPLKRTEYYGRSVLLEYPSRAPESSGGNTASADEQPAGSKPVDIP